MTRTSTRRTLAALAVTGAPVRLKDSGVLVWSGTRTTLAPSGSFEVERRIANRAGTDTITAYARHATSGQTCSARLSLRA